jgi:hypothetical protein
MQLASGATAVWISAAALQQIEGPLNHRLRAREPTQQATHRGVSSPELLSQFGRIGGQLYVHYVIRIQLSSKFTSLSAKTCPKANLPLDHVSAAQPAAALLSLLPSV